MNRFRLSLKTPKTEFDRWNPKKKISRKEIETVKILKREQRLSTEQIARKFGVSYEAIKRISRSNWTPEKNSTALKMPLDLTPLKSKDPEGLDAEKLLKAGHKFPLTSKQQRIEQCKQQKAQRQAFPINNPIDINDMYTKYNRNKRYEVEKFKQEEASRLEEKIRAAHQNRLAERNQPLLAKTEKNRQRRLDRKIKKLMHQRSPNPETRTSAEFTEHTED